MPGAGKTTRILLYFKDACWLAGKTIVMLEPRRLAARVGAAYMAKSLSEAVGKTVGFRVRYKSKVSTRTKIGVVTEGILARRLQSDPELSGVGLLILTSFMREVSMRIWGWLWRWMFNALCAPTSGSSSCPPLSTSGRIRAADDHGGARYYGWQPVLRLVSMASDG